jgi:hypothetical protein
MYVEEISLKVAVIFGFLFLLIIVQPPEHYNDHHHRNHNTYLLILRQIPRALLAFMWA